MAKYIQKGNVVDYKNTGDKTIQWGDVAALPSRIGIAEAEIPPGETGSIALTGVYEMDSAAEQIAYGDAVYWDKAAGVVTKTADGNIPAGMSLTEKAAAEAGPIAVRIG